jgi:FKBP-type peptidyl-prolyl cis-trans isomerase
MMKNLFSFLLIALIANVFCACTNKNDDTEEWRDANDAAYYAFISSEDAKALYTETGPSGVWYKVINKGEGTVHPFQTASVKILYSGKYYDGTYFDAGTSGNGIPTSMSVAGTVRGFSFALQQMVVGDRWEIAIPYYLGYGEGTTDYYGYTSFKGYTTLFFDVELVEITQYPE